MRCIFVPEFEELHSPLRSARNQGGGGHGNAIFTWWDVEAAEVIAHSAEFNWNGDGDRLGEPRRGGRFSVAAFLKNPHDPTQRLLTYSVHLEVFCGIFGRLRQFSQILSHSKAHLSGHPYQMILGDLNTMAHGLARFFSRYCCDAMRWRSLGWSEAEWWQKNLMQVTPEWTGADGINALLAAHHHLEGRKLSKDRNRRGEEFVQELIEEELEDYEELEEHEELESNEGEDEGASNESKEDEGDSASSASNESSTSSSNAVDAKASTQSNTTSTNATSSTTQSSTNTTSPSSTAKSSSTRIFSVKQLKDLVNPHFYCPFSPRFDMTLRVRGFAGKLDWMLVRGLRCLGKGMENDRFDRSDHKLLWLRAEFLEGDGEDVGVRAYEEFRGSGEERRGRMASVLGPVLPVSRALLWGAAVGFLSTVMFLFMNNNKSRN